jgi:hypothetical protein
MLSECREVSLGRVGDGCGQRTRHSNKRKDDLNEEQGIDGTAVEHKAMSKRQVSGKW